MFFVDFLFLFWGKKKKKKKFPGVRGHALQNKSNPPDNSNNSQTNPTNINHQQ
jgi:hypothetical protein